MGFERHSTVSDVWYSDGVVDWLNDQLGVTVRTANLLPGATTAQVATFDVAGRAYVVKLFNKQFFVDEEPDRAIHEAAVLEALELVDISTPRLIGVDGDGARCGVPAVLMTLLPGERTVGSVHAPEIARIASRMHSADVTVPWSFERYTTGHETRPPRWGSDQGLWTDVLAAVESRPPHGNWGFIHRDYNTTNLLTDGDRISGVVDWLSGCMGPFGIDAARIRLDPTMDDRGAFADAVTRALVETGHDIVDPYWDLVDAVDWLPYYQGFEAVDRWGSPPQRRRLEMWTRDALDRL